jgi:hypothetical protein
VLYNAFLTLLLATSLCVSGVSTIMPSPFQFKISCCYVLFFYVPRVISSYGGLDYLRQEVDFIAPLHDRLTGSPNHNALIDRIQSQLQDLGLKVECDELPFTYFNGPLSEPSVSLGGKNMPVTSYSKYSGFTGAEGVTGKLVDLRTLSLEEMPDWDKAGGNIAFTNITNLGQNYQTVLPTWPGSPSWFPQNGSPESNAETLVHNLTYAANAGVRAVVYAWQNATTGIVEGQWVPFHNLYQGVPTVFVQGDYGGMQELADAVGQGVDVTVTLEATMEPKTISRTVWTVIEGTDLKNESMIINTHTDGTNVIEEDGYIALIAYAKELIANPPRRTTILLFVGQHMHYEAFAPPFSNAAQRATSRWLNQHPELWAGEGQTNAYQYGGQLKGVAGCCVEHMGAIHWDQNLDDNTWFATDRVEPELLYASTPQLNSMLQDLWIGANPNITRVSNPVDSLIPQAGEGYPFFLVDMPNFSLVTNPSYLLKIWSQDFDERQLVDLRAMQRQVDSFTRMWRAMDAMSAEEFGTQSLNGTQLPLHAAEFES